MDVLLPIVMIWISDPFCNQMVKYVEKLTMHKKIESIEILPEIILRKPHSDTLRGGVSNMSPGMRLIELTLKHFIFFLEK